MQITKTTIKVADLAAGYTDDGDDGVFAYNGKLCLRPAYQRSFCYDEKHRNAVIDTIRSGFPLNIMYWSLTDDGAYECLDGQQRSISICQYLHGDFCIKVDGNDKFYHNLKEEEKAAIDNYELEIYICEGTQEEKLSWFRVVNIAGITLTNQELLNATYCGSWLADAKNFFSKRNCVAGKLAENYISGNPIRQDYLETVLEWIADAEGLPSGQTYMAIHQHDSDANDLWLYFQKVIGWAKDNFPEDFAKKNKKITSVQDWGVLYNKYHGNTYNAATLSREASGLLLDDDVTKKPGIIPYLLSCRTKSDERSLSIRAFSDGQKMKAYERQRGICPICGEHFEIDEMQGDHIIPWCDGGKTVDDNLQMLCKKCNNTKADR